MYKNRYIITWMLHQIFVDSDKVMLAAGLNNDKPLDPSTELTN